MLDFFDRIIKLWMSSFGLYIDRLKELRFWFQKFLG
jgi:hypothetical protein